MINSTNNFGIIVTFLNKVCLFEALRPGQQYVSHFGTTSWVLPVLSYADEASCSRTQHRAPGEDRTHDLAIKRPVLSQ